MQFTSLASACIAGILLAGPLFAQQKLKVYISVDLEGIAGVVSNDQTQPNGRDYGWARTMMLAETNAAIAGAYDAGATEVLVNDSHGSQTNLRPDELDRRAALITGQPKPMGMTQGLDSTFDAAIYIGYHANGSVANAVHGHTFSGALKHVRLNGQEVGEYGLNGAVAGWFGVPVAFVSGDLAFVEEARTFFPGVDALAVKEGIGFYAARTLNPLDAREQIRAGVRAALVKRIARPPVRLTYPATLEIEVGELSWADRIAIVPGVKRSGRIVSYTASDMPTLYRMARVMMMLAQ
ncbi:MAG: D-aminopeptidase [Gemmatimonadaceae bacterium]|nr:D-aminopeptidase [Gemmatimonadaceae bacterium]